MISLDTKNFDINTHYYLSDNWIIREDSHFTPIYTAFNIKEGIKYKISSSLYLILKLLKHNDVSLSEIFKYLKQNNISIEFDDFLNFFDEAPELLGILEIKDESYSPPPLNHKLENFEHPNYDVPMSFTPFEAEIHLTSACNLKCKHCCIEASPSTEIENQLKPDDWCKIFDEFESLRFHKIILSGGEPLYYKGIHNILKYLTVKKFRIEVLTNGTMIDPEIAEYLSYYNFSTTISLDGKDQQVHEYLRGSNTFLKTINAIKLLSAKKAFYHISFTVHKKNMYQIEDVIKLGIEYNAYSVNFLILDNAGRAKSNKEMSLDKTDISMLSQTMQLLIKKYENIIKVGFLDPSIPDYKDLVSLNDKSELIFCTAGTTRVGVRSDGAIFPCVYGFKDNFFNMGYLKEDSLFDIWHSNNWGLFRGQTKLNDLNKCSDCSLAKSCTLKICRLKAYADKGDFYSVPPSCPIEA